MIEVPTGYKIQIKYLLISVKYSDFKILIVLESLSFNNVLRV